MKHGVEFGDGGGYCQEYGHSYGGRYMGDCQQRQFSMQGLEQSMQTAQGVSLKVSTLCTYFFLPYIKGSLVHVPIRTKGRPIASRFHDNYATTHRTIR